MSRTQHFVAVTSNAIDCSYIVYKQNKVSKMNGIGQLPFQTTAHFLNMSLNIET